MSFEDFLFEQLAYELDRLLWKKNQGPVNQIVPILLKYCWRALLAECNLSWFQAQADGSFRFPKVLLGPIGMLLNPVWESLRATTAIAIIMICFIISFCVKADIFIVDTSQYHSLFLQTILYIFKKYIWHKFLMLAWLAKETAFFQKTVNEIEAVKILKLRTLLESEKDAINLTASKECSIITFRTVENMNINYVMQVHVQLIFMIFRL